MAAGSYSLSARATDNRGAQTTSAAVGIQVSAPQNQPPSVSLTAPANAATYTAPASITLTASASDADGSIAKVEFLFPRHQAGRGDDRPLCVQLDQCARRQLCAYCTSDRQRWRQHDFGNSDRHGHLLVFAERETLCFRPMGVLPRRRQPTRPGIRQSPLTTAAPRQPIGAMAGGWNDADALLSYPDWLPYRSPSTTAQKTINRIDVLTIADNYSAGMLPTATTTFTRYGLTSFDEQYWSGSAWVTVPGGSVTSNNLAWANLHVPGSSRQTGSASLSTLPCTGTRASSKSRSPDGALIGHAISEGTIATSEPLPAALR